VDVVVVMVVVVWSVCRRGGRWGGCFYVGLRAVSRGPGVYVLCRVVPAQGRAWRTK
jgi:hypothetical protein